MIWGNFYSYSVLEWTRPTFQMSDATLDYESFLRRFTIHGYLC